MNPIAKFMLFAGTALLIGTVSGIARAGTLENLERERASLLQTFLDPSMGTAERIAKVEATKPRLIDLERMVLRDESLTGRNTPVVRKAFANYDLTFLAHASIEKSRAPIDVWLEQMGVTTDTVMAATLASR